jgi:hypothetical protein
MLTVSAGGLLPPEVAELSSALFSDAVVEADDVKVLVRATNKNNRMAKRTSELNKVCDQKFTLAGANKRAKLNVGP